MKKVIFGLLSIVSIMFTSCDKGEISSDVNKEGTQLQSSEMAPSFSQENAKKTASRFVASQFNGKYELKYTNTINNRAWQPATLVGLSFMPDTFNYSTNVLNFNPTTNKVILSAKSVIKGLPDAVFGSSAFTVKGQSLKIVTPGSEERSGNFTIYYFDQKWLVLEDVRTKIAWAFLKS
jgi:hypothetical protein